MKGRKRGDLCRAAAYAIVIIGCLVAWLPLTNWAGEATKTKTKAGGATFQGDRQNPIVITSDTMEADRKNNVITYKGRVVVVQGEMTVKSNILTAHFTPEMKEFKEIIAEGNVRVTQEDRIATGAKAVFDHQKQTITLTGDPVVRQGNNEISGDRIVFFTVEERAVAEGSVKARIFPDELKKKDKEETRPSKQP